MIDFVCNCILWTLAIYGLIDLCKITKNYFTHRRIESDGFFFIVAVKNQEQKIEFLLRSIISKILHSKEDCLKNVIVTDLNSEDNTKEILEKFSTDYEEVKLVEWSECKSELDKLE